MGNECIYGFDIEKRELTEEEKTRDLTVDRIREFHYLVGEDFLDTCDTVNAEVFAGYLLAKFPHKNKEILNILNKKKNFLECMSFSDIDIFSYDDKLDMDKLYVYYCDFINLTGANKERDNQVLIQVVEHYKG